jgi:hypothetical protein
LDLPGVPRGDAALGIELCDKESVDHVAQGCGHFEGVPLGRLERPGIEVKGDVLAGAACFGSGHDGEVVAGVFTLVKTKRN